MGCHFSKMKNDRLHLGWIHLAGSTPWITPSGESSFHVVMNLCREAPTRKLGSGSQKL